ncbi:MAG: beta-N-acetylhexosaminidase [Bacteroidaceae bacterium]|nr:beta-N-acetylhexosaminidase [Bacteroidaceae bacterium]
MKKVVSLFFALLLFAGNFSASAQRADYDVIPLPKEVKEDSTQVFTLRQGMGVAYDAANPEVYRNVQFFCQWVEEMTGITLKLTPDDKKAAIRVGLDYPISKGEVEAELTEQEKEAYIINVDKKGLTIRARKPVGLFRAAQTIRKSLPVEKKAEKVEFPFVEIKDQPRFEYRGVLLDCGRHFFTVEFIKQFIDVMALHGSNQFHWHLTEDQGWRFEVKAYPSLAPVGSVRTETQVGTINAGIFDGTPYGGYYTQDECREVVRYAAERYINVVPEIDLPGHMQSALHVFPHLGCTGGPYPVRTYWGVSREVLCGGNPETMTFLKTVLGELCDVFPSKYIHIGGDECPKDRWNKCAKCQAKIKELGIKGDDKHKFSAEHQLQSWINREVEEFMKVRGRAIIGWDEILEGGLSGSSIVMSWRGVKGGIAAARQGHRVIMSPNVYSYIDHPQLKDYYKQPRTTDSYVVSASKIHSFEPLIPDSLTQEQQRLILGPQVNLWTEHVAYPDHAFYQLLPRLGASSEVQWCQPEQKDFESFKKRLPQLQKIYAILGVVYCRQVE